MRHVEEIKRLKDRISFRGDQIADSQDGTQIFFLEQSQASDVKVLRRLQAEQTASFPQDEASDALVKAIAAYKRAGWDCNDMRQTASTIWAAVYP